MAVIDLLDKQDEFLTTNGWASTRAGYVHESGATLELHGANGRWALCYSNKCLARNYVHVEKLHAKLVARIERDEQRRLEDIEWEEERRLERIEKDVDF